MAISSVLAYHDNARTRWSANLAQNIGQSAVAYLERSGGPQASVIDDAPRYGRGSGTLRAAAARLLPDPAVLSFRNEIAAGASYTTALPRITFNVGLNYIQAGFSDRDRDNWFSAARRAGAPGPVTDTLWYLRNYASDQQQPISRRFAFLRADCVDAFVPKLELCGFVDADLLDGSGRFQLSANYYLSDRSTVGGLLLVNFGTERSDFGNLPQAGSVLIKLARYF